MMPAQVAVRVTEVSQAGDARRRASALALKAGLNETDAGRVAVVATELARNLANHARDGEILLRADARGVEVLAIDRGPGMKSPAECLRDGYSTAGTPGTGLGAARRMSSLFDLYTQPEKGTVLLARVDAGARRSSEPLHLGVVSLAVNGEEVCGDQWALRVSGSLIQIMIADGLGHGVVAYQAACEAVHVFETSRSRGLRELMESMNAALRATRGAAVGIAELRLDTREVLYHAVGNISGGVVTAKNTKQIAYLNGTVGRETRPARGEFRYPFPPGATLVLNSDGLASWHDMDKYPGVLAHHPAILAGLLYRDLRRTRDDVTVLAIREDGNQEFGIGD